MAPNLTATRRGTFLSWIEPRAGGGHVLRASRLDSRGNRFEPPAVVAEGDDFFANWADFPALAEAADGSLYGHWLRKISAGTYAYGIALARSSDGSEWAPIGWLHQDLSPTEHGFVSYAATTDGLAAFWLDGREMERPAGAMALRARLLEGESDQEHVLDDRVCECCQTDAAVTDQGPIVVYRNRSEEEVRDIWRVRWEGSGWSEPAPVHEDGWQISGCPVNGPAVAAESDTVAVAWFTAADNSPQVKLALSVDAGASFGEAMILDDQAPIGRVDVGVLGSSAWVSWLGRTSGGSSDQGPDQSSRQAVVKMRRIDLDPGRAVAAPAVEVGETSAARNAGFPRLLLEADRLLVAWVETGEPSRIRVTSLPQ